MLSRIGLRLDWMSEHRQSNPTLTHPDVASKQCRHKRACSQSQAKQRTRAFEPYLHIFALVLVGSPPPHHPITTPYPRSQAKQARFHSHSFISVSFFSSSWSNPYAFRTHVPFGLHQSSAPRIRNSAHARAVVGSHVAPVSTQPSCSFESINHRLARPAPPKSCSHPVKLARNCNRTCCKWLGAWRRPPTTNGQTLLPSSSLPGSSRVRVQPALAPLPLAASIPPLAPPPSPASNVQRAS